MSYVLRKVRNEAIAQDIVQDTYVRIRSAQLPPSISNPQAFVYRVAGNLALNHLKQERARSVYVSSGELPEDVPFDEPMADVRLANQQLLEHMLRVLGELPPRRREVFVLRKFHELSMEEISRQLGISVSMVEKHLQRAVQHCAARLRVFEEMSEGRAHPSKEPSVAPVLVSSDQGRL
jgi:RNA polymerase sigma-70 factor (ECF subfamily)